MTIVIDTVPSSPGFPQQLADGSTLAVPQGATLQLRDSETGEVVDPATIGNERQPDGSLLLSLPDGTQVTLTQVAQASQQTGERPQGESPEANEPGSGPEGQGGGGPDAGGSSEAVSAFFDDGYGTRFEASPKGGFVPASDTGLSVAPPDPNLLALLGETLAAAIADQTLPTIGLEQVMVLEDNGQTLDLAELGVSGQAVVREIPLGATLLDDEGEAIDIVDGGEGTGFAVVEAEGYDGGPLTVVPPEHDDSDFQLVIESTVATFVLPVQVKSVADAPDIETLSTDGCEDNAEPVGEGMWQDADFPAPNGHGLAFGVAAVDQDGSETLSRITLSSGELPEGAVWTANGAPIADGDSVTFDNGGEPVTATASLGPDGATLVLVLDQTGDPILAVGTLGNEIGIALPPHAHGSFTIDIEAQSQEAYSQGPIAEAFAVQQSSFELTVLAVADKPAFSAVAADPTRDDDGPVPLAFTVETPDRDGSEGLSELKVSGLPEGATLGFRVGGQSVTVQDGDDGSEDGMIAIDLSQFSDGDAGATFENGKLVALDTSSDGIGLRFSPPFGFSTEVDDEANDIPLDLRIAVTSTEMQDHTKVPSQTATLDLAVVVEPAPVADTPTIQTDPIVVCEDNAEQIDGMPGMWADGQDNAHGLPLAVSLADQDGSGSERIESITITAPAEAMVQGWFGPDGPFDDGGTLTFANDGDPVTAIVLVDDASSLTLEIQSGPHASIAILPGELSVLLPGHKHGSFDFAVEAVVHEPAVYEGEPRATATATLSLEVQAVAEKPVFADAVAAPVLDDDGSVPLDVTVGTPDRDGSEGLTTLEISGLPVGAHLSYRIDGETVVVEDSLDGDEDGTITIDLSAFAEGDAGVIFENGKLVTLDTSESGLDLRFLPAPGFATDTPLDVRLAVTAAEMQGGDKVAEQNSSVALSVDVPPPPGVADAPTIGAGTQIVCEDNAEEVDGMPGVWADGADNAHGLSLTVSVDDLDSSGSERIESIAITAPAEAMVQGWFGPDGPFDDGGTLTFANDGDPVTAVALVDDASTLTLEIQSGPHDSIVILESELSVLLPDHKHGSFDFTVEASVHEPAASAGEDSASNAATLTLEVQAVADKPLFSSVVGEPAQGDDGGFPLDLAVSTPDSDGSEGLTTLEISGLPLDATLSYRIGGETVFVQDNFDGGEDGMIAIDLSAFTESDAGVTFENSKLVALDTSENGLDLRILPPPGFSTPVQVATMAFGEGFPEDPQSYSEAGFTLAPRADFLPYQAAVVGLADTDGYLGERELVLGMIGEGVEGTPVAYVVQADNGGRFDFASFVLEEIGRGTEIIVTGFDGATAIGNFVVPNDTAPGLVTLPAGFAGLTHVEITATVAPPFADDDDPGIIDDLVFVQSTPLEIRVEATAAEMQGGDKVAAQSDSVTILIDAPAPLPAADAPLIQADPLLVCEDNAEEVVGTPGTWADGADNAHGLPLTVSLDDRDGSGSERIAEITITAPDSAMIEGWVHSGGPIAEGTTLSFANGGDTVTAIAHLDGATLTLDIQSSPHSTIAILESELGAVLPAHKHGQFDFTIEATVQEPAALPGADQASSSTKLTLEVEAVADKPQFSAVVGEPALDDDGSVPLDLAVRTPDRDGSEGLTTLEVSGLPVGAHLSYRIGGQTVVVEDSLDGGEDGTIAIDLSAFAETDAGATFDNGKLVALDTSESGIDLRFLPPPGFSTDAPLDILVDVTAAEMQGGDKVAEQSSRVILSVDLPSPGVADTPAIQALAEGGCEDNALEIDGMPGMWADGDHNGHGLSLTVSLDDLDGSGSETIESIVITAPDGIEIVGWLDVAGQITDGQGILFPNGGDPVQVTASIADGSLTLDVVSGPHGSIAIQPGELGVILADHVSGRIDFTVEATVQEPAASGDDAQATGSTSVTLEVEAVADKAVFQALEPVETVIESEAFNASGTNDSGTSAEDLGSLAPGGALTVGGWISVADSGDVDFYSFSLSADATVTFDIDLGIGGEDIVDTQLSLFSLASGSPVQVLLPHHLSSDPTERAADDDSGDNAIDDPVAPSGNDPFVSLALTAGDYVVAVSSFDYDPDFSGANQDTVGIGQGGTTSGDYRLQIRTQDLDLPAALPGGMPFTVATPDQDGSESLTLLALTVPAGATLSHIGPDGSPVTAKDLDNDGLIEIPLGGYDGDPAVPGATVVDGKLVMLDASANGIALQLTLPAGSEPPVSGTVTVGIAATTTEFGEPSLIKVDEQTESFEIEVPAVVAPEVPNQAPLLAMPDDTMIDGMFVAAGPAFTVNTQIDSDQLTPSVAASDSGGILVVWQTDDPDVAGATGQEAIAARFFGHGGMPLADQAGPGDDGEIQVDSRSLRVQQAPDVAQLGNGSFVVVWHSDNRDVDGSEEGIAARILNPDGSEAVAEFTVNQEVLQAEILPSVTALADGRFVVTWLDKDGTSQATSGDFKGRIFEADGTPVTDDFFVETIDTHVVREASVSALANGGFVVAMGMLGIDGDLDGIAARIFEADGSPLVGQGLLGRSDEFLVNQVTQGGQVEPSVAGLADGGFVVTWKTFQPDGSGGGHGDIAARLFDDKGLPLGPEFVVNTHQDASQANPAVAALSDGGFVIVWDSTADALGTGIQIAGQVYSASGEPKGGEFVVGGIPGHGGSNPDVAALPDGGFAVSWSSGSADGDDDGKGILTRIFHPVMPTFGAGSPPILLAPGLSVHDVDGSTLQGATVAIASFVPGEDVLAVGADLPAGVSATFDSGTGVLSIAGEASLAAYEAILRSVTYHNVGSPPAATPRSIDFQVDDGNSQYNLSNVKTVVVQIAGGARADTAIIQADTQVVCEDNAEEIPGMPGMWADGPDNAHSLPLTVTLDDLDGSGTETITRIVITAPAGAPVEGWFDFAGQITSGQGILFANGGDPLSVTATIDGDSLILDVLSGPHGTVELALGEIGVILADDVHGDFDFTVEATVFEPAAAPEDQLATSSTTLTLAVEAVAEKPDFTEVQPHPELTGSSMPLEFTVSTSDRDGSEALTELKISGLPLGSGITYLDPSPQTLFDGDDGVEDGTVTIDLTTFAEGADGATFKDGKLVELDTSIDGMHLRFLTPEGFTTELPSVTMAFGEGFPLIGTSYSESGFTLAPKPDFSNPGLSLTIADYDGTLEEREFAPGVTGSGASAEPTTYRLTADDGEPFTFQSFDLEGISVYASLVVTAYDGATAKDSLTLPNITAPGRIDLPPSFRGITSVEFTSVLDPSFPSGSLTAVIDNLVLDQVPPLEFQIEATSAEMLDGTKVAEQSQTLTLVVEVPEENREPIAISDDTVITSRRDGDLMILGRALLANDELPFDGQIVAVGDASPNLGGVSLTADGNVLISGLPVYSSSSPETSSFSYTLSDGFRTETATVTIHRETEFGILDGNGGTNAGNSAGEIYISAFDPPAGGDDPTFPSYVTGQGNDVIIVNEGNRFQVDANDNGNMLLAGIPLTRDPGETYDIVLPETFLPNETGIWIIDGRDAQALDGSDIPVWLSGKHGTTTEITNDEWDFAGVTLIDIDMIYSGFGDDFIRNSFADDVVRGGRGADELDGGYGISLDFGSDTYLWLAEDVGPDPVVDTVLNFSTDGVGPGQQGDVLDIADLFPASMNAETVIADGFITISTGNFGAGSTTLGDAKLSIDLDGGGDDVDQEIVLADRVGTILSLASDHQGIVDALIDNGNLILEA